MDGMGGRAGGGSCARVSGWSAAFCSGGWESECVRVRGGGEEGDERGWGVAETRGDEAGGRKRLLGRCDVGARFTDMAAEAIELGGAGACSL